MAGASIVADTVTSYAHTNSAIGKYGRWTVSTNLVAAADNSQIWLRFYGKKLEIQASGSAVEASVDGGAFSSVSVTGSMGWVIAWSGTEGWHNIIIANNNAGTVSYNTAATLRITGTDGSQQIAAHPNSGPYEQILTTPFSTYGVHTMLGVSTALGYTSPSRPEVLSGTNLGVNVSVRRKATWSAGSKILAWMYSVNDGIAPSVALRVDGIQYGIYTTQAGSGNGIFGFIIADLPGSGTHEIELISRRGIDAIMISDGSGGSNASFVSTALTARAKKIVFLGDSQTFGVGANSYSAFVFDSLGTMAVDYTTYNLGVSGETVAQMTARFSSDVTPHAPVRLVIHAGYNNSGGAEYASLKTDYKALLDKAISDLPSLERIYCLLISGWTNQANINTTIQTAISEWTAANPTWSSKLTTLTQLTTVDQQLSHISSIGYAQIHGESTGVIKLTGQPSDGDTITIASRGTTKVFEFDNNSSVTGGRVSVTIGADTAATNYNLFLALVAQYEAGFKGKPLVRVNDGLSIGCAVSKLASISKSGTNITVYGPYRDGFATDLKNTLDAWPTPTWTNISGETASSLALGTVDLSHHGRKFRCVATNTGGSATSDTAKLTVN